MLSYSDKAKEVKMLSQQIIEKVIEELGLPTVKGFMNGLKPAVKDSVKLIFKKYNPEQVEVKK